MERTKFKEYVIRREPLISFVLYAIIVIQN